jgi:hypothetical protein
MSFKLKSPYKINPVSVHQVPFSPDNIGESNGLVAKANDNGTIIMNKNIPKDSKLYNNAMSHEGRHLKDMMDNKLAYDENFVYENMDGKGAKKHSRSNFSEDDKTLSWEAPAYKDGDNGVEHDLRPKPNKLSGVPSMKDETPIAFKVMGSRHKEGRSPDKEKISMNERFAMYAPAKTWGGPSLDTDPLVSGGEPDGGGNTDTDPPYSPTKKEDYRGAYITYSPSSGDFYYTGRTQGDKKIKDLDDIALGKNKGKFDYSKRLDLDEDSGIDPYNPNVGGERHNYNAKFNQLIKNTPQRRQDYISSNSYFKDNPHRFEPTERTDSGKGDGSTVSYTLSPDFRWDDTQNNLSNMNRMEYVESFFDKEGKPSDKYAGGKLKFGKSEGDDEETKYLNKSNPLFKTSLTKKASKYVSDNFAKQDTALQEFMKNHPNTFKLM